MREQSGGDEEPFYLNFFSARAQVAALPDCLGLVYFFEVLNLD